MKDQYRQLAESYDKQLKDKLTKKMYNEWREELETALKRFKINKGTLVDLGCGTGISTIPYINKFNKIIGVEISKPMLKEARKKSSKVKWMNQDIINLKIKEQADVVTCHFDVLNHILKKKDLQKIFQNVYDILSNRGIFIFDLMSPESFEWLKKKGRKSEVPERSYLKEEVKEMLDKSGFNILKIKKQKTKEWDGKPRRFIFISQKY